MMRRVERTCSDGQGPDGNGGVGGELKEERDDSDEELRAPFWCREMLSDGTRDLVESDLVGSMTEASRLLAVG